MLALPFALAQLRELTPAQLRAALSQFLPADATPEQRIAAVESLLNSPVGPTLRAEMARWIVDHAVPVHALVPHRYEHLRPLVRDAMKFEVLHLSAGRLAPKLIQQIETPSPISPEKRLFLLIAKVPGLQKLGQVLARNRHLKPSLRNWLSKLENGIRDVSHAEILAVIHRELGPKIQQFGIQVSSSILSEASVSAVVRFTWRDPASGERRCGVFKVLKPHIRAYFAEDMDLLHRMANHLGTQHSPYGYAPRVIQDTFRKVRQLLEHEVDFSGEQRTLVEVARRYRNISGARIPAPIAQLCSSRLTAMTQQPGSKVTNAAKRLQPAARKQLAERLTEALIAAPLCAPEEVAVFHGDPHAGNLLFDTSSGDLSIIDWALTERLTRDQRRHLALLVAMVAMRNPASVCHEIHALADHGLTRRQTSMIRDYTAEFLASLPLVRRPPLTDAMQLLERISLRGVRFPASLIMFSKVIFTLDGIVEDIRGSSTMGAHIARNFLQRWLSSKVRLGAPLASADWMNIFINALIYGGKVAVNFEEKLLTRYRRPESQPA